MTDELRALDVGAAIGGRYAILRSIAKGGMGEVYLAIDHRLNRQVAIKVLRADRIGFVGHERFQREIAISGRLSHPNIVPVYDSGEVESIVYFVMPYEEGESLRDRMRREVQLPIDDALRIIYCLADALSYAHGQGVIHRDVKPENVILQADQALITDFGIAKFVKPPDADTLTSDQTAVGTLAYMSPEQATATKGLDARSDQYSLALVLYEMLAGELPFRAATPEAMMARKAIGRYPPLRDARSTVPPQIDAAIARALQPVPADRFRSVENFARALRSPRPWKLGIRRPRLLLMAGLTLVVAGAGAVASTRFGPFARQQLDAASLGRLVVAPFDNRTGNPTLDVVGVMAGDWITEGLQNTGIVEVVPITTSVPASRYVSKDGSSGNAEHARSLASETGATTVVTGSIYRQGDSLYFRANVADRDGARLIGTISDIVAPLSNPVQGVEQLRNKLMGWLSVRYDDRLQPPGLASNRAPTYEAYRTFSEGMTDYIDVNNAKALPLFLDAYSLDSSFTIALLYASIAASNLGDFARADSLLHLVNARRNELSEYHRAWLDYRLGFVTGNRQKALEAIRLAARDAPQSKASYNHALEAFYSGYFGEALAAIKSIAPGRGAMRGFAPYWDFYGTILHATGRYEEELAVGRQSRAQYPDRLTSYRSLSRAFAALHNLDSLASLTNDAEHVPTDPVGWDYGHMLSEVAEELQAHSEPRAAVIYFKKLEAWLATRLDTNPSARLRHIRALLALGRFAEAETELKVARAKDSSNVEYLGIAGLIAARTGKIDEANQVIDSLSKRHEPYQFGITSLLRARIYAAIGDKVTAVNALQDAFAEGRSYDLSLHRDPYLQELKGYAPFERLLRGR